MKVVAPLLRLPVRQTKMLEKGHGDVDVDYQRFKEKIEKKTGIDLSMYKEEQMKRRLTSLRRRHDSCSFRDFYEKMLNNNTVLEAFLDKVTINVSEFFRNPNRWESFEKDILPYFINNNEHLKIWSAGCSTGEEPYTIAIILSKYMPLSNISVLATDIDDNVLSRAKKGFYTEDALKNVPQEVKDEYFIATDLGYVIHDHIRNAVKFRKHNLLADPYGKNFDFIVCRNVLIYFVEEARDRVYQNFSDSLKQGGVLFVGSTEQISNPERYSLHSKQVFFYEKVK